MKTHIILGSLVLAASSVAMAQSEYRPLELQALAQHCKSNSFILYHAAKEGSAIVCAPKEGKHVVYIESNFIADRYIVNVLPVLVTDFEKELAGART